MKKIRIVIITQGLSFIVKPMLNSGDEVVGIVESASRNYNPVIRASCMEKLKTIYHRLCGIDSLEQFAKRQHVPYVMLDKTNHEQVAEVVRKWQPDLIVVYSMSQLLRQSIFSIPRLGTINVHPSKLPAYRGPNPTLWMYYDMELNPGVTVHYIDEWEDTGDIIKQGTFAMTLGMSMEKRQVKEHELALRLLAEAIEQLKSNTAKPCKQPKESPTPRARNITVAEAADFIPWKDWNVERVWHFLRGEGDIYPFIQQPKGWRKGQKWLYESYVYFNEVHKAGSIYEENSKYYLACKDGRIELVRDFSWKRFLKQCMSR